MEFHHWFEDLEDARDVLRDFDGLIL